MEYDVWSMMFQMLLSVYCARMVAFCEAFKPGRHCKLVLLYWNPLMEGGKIARYLKNLHVKCERTS